MAKRGISLLDLASPFPGAQALVPDDLASRLENLAVISHRSTVSAGAIVHAGVVQPVSDLGFPSLRNWPVEVPGLNSGLPFRLVRTRNAAGAGQTLEPAGAGAFVDLVVDRIAITVPGLRPATLVPTAPAVVAHLLPDGTKSGVKIVGAGVVRIDLTGSGDVVRFVDWPDPFDPAAPSGAVYRVTFDPVSFYIGGSEIGMVVDRLVFDASTQVTPPEIIARGQTPGWQGISIAEATLLLPPDAPLVDKLTVGVKDVLLGSPAGLQGEIQVELGRTPISGAAVEFLQDFAGSEQPRTVSGTGRSLTVPFITGTPSTGRMRAKLNPSALGSSTQPHMQWTLPAGDVIDQDDSGWFETSVGETMSGVFSEEVSGERVFDDATAYTFVQSEATVQHAAPVNAHVGAVDIGNVVAVSGTSRGAVAARVRVGAEPGRRRRPAVAARRRIRRAHAHRPRLRADPVERPGRQLRRRHGLQAADAADPGRGAGPGRAPDRRPRRRARRDRHAGADPRRPADLRPERVREGRIAGALLQAGDPGRRHGDGAGRRAGRGDGRGRVGARSGQAAAAGDGGGGAAPPDRVRVRAQQPGLVRDVPAADPAGHARGVGGVVGAVLHRRHVRRHRPLLRPLLRRVQRHPRHQPGDGGRRVAAGRLDAHPRGADRADAAP